MVLREILTTYRSCGMYTLGAWGRHTDDAGVTTFTAPVYEPGTNACVYWAVVEPVLLKASGVPLWRVSVERHGTDERVMTALKETAKMARGYAERWVDSELPAREIA